MKVALAHHWITSYRGGERVLEQIAAIFPGVDIHTLVHDSNVLVPGLAGHRILPSLLNRLPKITKTYRHLLPIHPWAIRRMQLAEDVQTIISSDASLVKGIATPAGATHVCYCHSPPRYLWELGDDYKNASWVAHLALDRFAPTLRQFDYLAAQQVTHFIANSRFVAERIARYYHRDAVVVYPPVAVDDFRFDRPREDFYLVISELVPYKRIDLAVQAFNRLGRRLVVIGDGPDRKRLQSLAAANIEFLGRQPFGRLKDHLETAKAFIFPGIEDFGITPVEAQAAGCPVIAFAQGGALETVLQGRTGVFFGEQDAQALAQEVNEFRAADINPLDCRTQAEKFSIQEFQARFSQALAAFDVSLGHESILRDALSKVG